MSTRVAKKKPTNHVRLVLYVPAKIFDQIEALSEASSISRAAAVSIAIARHHRSEVKQGRLAPLAERITP